MNFYISAHARNAARMAVHPPEMPPVWLYARPKCRPYGCTPEPKKAPAFNAGENHLFNLSNSEMNTIGDKIRNNIIHICNTSNDGRTAHINVIVFEMFSFEIENLTVFRFGVALRVAKETMFARFSRLNHNHTIPVIFNPHLHTFNPFQ